MSYPALALAAPSSSITKRLTDPIMAAPSVEVVNWRAETTKRLIPATDSTTIGPICRAFIMAACMRQPEEHGLDYIPSAKPSYSKVLGEQSSVPRFASRGSTQLNPTRRRTTQAQLTCALRQLWSDPWKHKRVDHKPANASPLRNPSNSAPWLKLTLHLLQVRQNSSWRDMC
ncbi:hypothetical protein BU16DRAFT_556780 [Lophium mytilinum]|uniref:Uncharacterized protein n=1 Tax=Lophium mytilinum TaxID=390894 RepID=A0A6A6R7F0_9PEZI|nr:hypothetical protein BU16DRAFT_556780 [Lophium mytilinum]